MRLDSRVDANQPEIVAAARAAGATVQHLHPVGRGCPDLLVGYHGINLLVEVKVPGEDLTIQQRNWHESWRGQKVVVRTIEELLAIMERCHNAPTAD